MTIPKFTRTHTKFAGGDDIHGKFIEPQMVKVLGEVPDQGEDDEESDMWRVKLASGDIIVVDGCDMHPRPDAGPDNIEFVSHLMQWGQTAFTQAFIIEASIRYAESILADEDKTREQMSKSYRIPI